MDFAGCDGLETAGFRGFVPVVAYLRERAA